MPSVAIIGSGFSGLSAAAYLSSKGYRVSVFEKKAAAGGRASTFTTPNGYLFDMGPSWYWMPDVFERFFQDFGYSVSDLYELQLLDPSFEVIFKENNISIPANYSALRSVFESIEKGSSERLRAFMQEAEAKYKTAMDSLVYKPGLSLYEFADMNVIGNMMRLQVFSSFSEHVRKYFSDPRLQALMEFPILFLGAMPQETPALYSLMNYAGLKLGTWYPMGGFGKVIQSIVKIASEKGSKFYFNSAVDRIIVEDGKANGVQVNGEEHFFDAVIASADYEHVERTLLPRQYRNYTSEFWNKKTFAPSCLIYYVGLNKKLPRLKHHTLFFDENLLEHSIEIYRKPSWPSKPLFYVCCPSKTDKSVAPEGHENLFFLMPIAPGLQDTSAQRENYFKVMLQRLEKHVGEKIEQHIDYKRSYCVSDFISDYNSYKGNAYGLANTLKQTAIFKPKIVNKKIKNLFYAGQLTVPGPGVPPALISGKLAADQLVKYFKRQKNEVTI